MANKRMLWIVAPVLILSGFGLLAYQLWQNIPLKAGSLAIGDLTNIVAMVVALVSLYVAVATYQQSIKDSEEQQKNLEASRQQLQTVAQTLNQQQEIQAKNLETSKDLFGLQKEQQTVLTESLEITRSLYQLQKDERERVRELASRKPKIQAIINGQIVQGTTAAIELVLKGNDITLIPMAIRNIGSTHLIHPVFTAVASNKKTSIWFEGKGITQPVHRTQLNFDLDLLPFEISEATYESSIGLSGPFPELNFEVEYRVAGDNLDRPFKITIHVHLKRE
jgi:hypothetical protein